MDLWATLGISPVAGIGVVIAGVVVAAAARGAPVPAATRAPRFVGSRARAAGTET